MNDTVKEVLTATPAKKKGNASWKPREHVDVAAPKDGNFRYRYVNAADDHRISTLIAQGWELCSAINGERTYKGVNAAARIIEGQSLDTVVGNSDRVMMRLPVEEAAKRDAYYETKAKSRVKGIKDFAQSAVGATMKGEIKIGGKNVAEIED